MQLCSGSANKQQQASESAGLSAMFLPSLFPSLRLFTFLVFVLLQVLEAVFLKLSLSLHPSPSHLCPVLRQWSWLPISMVTG